MDETSETIDKELGVIITAANSIATKIQPTIVDWTYQILAYGFLHKLEPKADLTPFELWNIIRWTNIVRNTWFGASKEVYERVWDKANELGIRRHFTSQQFDFTS